MFPCCDSKGKKVRVSTGSFPASNVVGCPPLADVTDMQAPQKALYCPPPNSVLTSMIIYWQRLSNAFADLSEISRGEWGGNFKLGSEMR